MDNSRLSAAERVADASLAYWDIWDLYVHTPWDKSKSARMVKNLELAEAKLKRAMEDYVRRG